MKSKLYISASELSFTFESEAERDLFFENLASNKSFGFAPQDAAEKVGPETVKIDASKFPVGYCWPVEFI